MEEPRRVASATSARLDGRGRVCARSPPSFAAPRQLAAPAVGVRWCRLCSRHRKNPTIATSTNHPTAMSTYQPVLSPDEEEPGTVMSVPRVSATVAPDPEAVLI